MHPSDILNHYRDLALEKMMVVQIVLTKQEPEKPETRKCNYCGTSKTWRFYRHMSRGKMLGWLCTGCYNTRRKVKENYHARHTHCYTCNKTFPNHAVFKQHIQEQH